MKNNFWIFVILVILPLAIYSNSIRGEFISDDQAGVVENIKVHSISGYFSKYFTPRASEINNILFAFNWHFGKDNPFGYHLTAQIFHIINTILVFLLIQLILRNNILALFTALLFSVHTVNTQVVNWISALGYAVMGIFYFPSLIFYVKFRNSQRVIFYFLSLTLFLLGLDQNFALITLPFLILIYEFIINKDSRIKFKKSLKYYLFTIPYLLSVGVYVFVSSGVISSRLQVCNNLWMVNYKTTALPNHIAIITKLFVYYMKMLIWPLRLGLSHRFTYNFSLVDIYLFLAIAVIFILIALIFILRKINKEFAFGLAWFFVTMLPYSNILHVASDIGERYLYLPSVGFCLVVASCIAWIPLIFKNKLSKQSIAVLTGILFVIVLGYYSVLTVRRNSEYKTRISFWESNLRYFPINGFVYNDLGNAYYMAGREEDAIKSYLEALKLNPFDPKANYNLGVIYHLKGMLAEAFNLYQKTLQVDPKDFQAHFNLGAIYEAKDMTSEAISEYRQAIKLNPTYINPYFKLGILLQRRNLLEEAIKIYQTLLYYQPENAAVRSNVGAAYYNLGLINEARKEIQNAINLQPDFSEAYYNLGLIEAREKNFSAAESIYVKLKAMGAGSLADRLQEEIAKVRK